MLCCVCSLVMASNYFAFASDDKRNVAMALDPKELDSTWSVHVIFINK